MGDVDSPAEAGASPHPRLGCAILRSLPVQIFELNKFRVFDAAWHSERHTGGFDSDISIHHKS
jgi:hypothetical protein